MGLRVRNGLRITGGAVVAAALSLAGGLIVVTPGPTSAATDEDQVRAALDGMNGSYNRSDFDTFASHLCAGMLRVDDFEAGWYESREADGPTRITINSVDVIGDGAVANVRFEAAKHEDAKTLDVDFVREGAEWKACRYHAGRTV